MHTRRFQSSIFGASLGPQSATLAILLTLLFLIIGLLFIILTAQPAQAQTFKVIHNFTGGPDGYEPIAGLTIDAAGNLYGTASNGIPGSCDSSACGTVFKMTHVGSGWLFNILYSFPGGNDGGHPKARVIFGPDGSLYGTTSNGAVGSYCRFGDGCGTVFRLKPPATACATALCPWNETVLHRFTFGYNDDGGHPTDAVIFDQAGNIYGTALDGGYLDCNVPYGCGMVFELTPSQGGWTESIMYKFDALGQHGGHNGYPYGGLTFDKAGNLYGTASKGYDNCGVVFQLTPSASGWQEHDLHRFSSTGEQWCEGRNRNDDGAFPGEGWLIFDDNGNLYGTTEHGGAYGSGTVFMLSPSGGGWTFQVLYAFTNGGVGPKSGLSLDAAGNLYGATYSNGVHGAGSVFKLSPSDGGWTYTSLHDFTGGSDGADPYSNVTLGTNGKLYGTTQYGGAYGSGVVWEITP